QLQVYRKSIRSTKFLHYNSVQDINNKKSVAYSLFNRALTIPNNEDNKQLEVNNVFNLLKLNGYKSHFLNKILSQVNDKLHGRTKNSQETNTLQEKAAIITNFIGNSMYKLKRKLNEEGCKMIFKPTRKLNTFLPKYKNNTSVDTNVVYKIDCKKCDLSYIGQTAQYLSKRIAQHKYAVDGKWKKKSALAE